MRINDATRIKSFVGVPSFTADLLGPVGHAGISPQPAPEQRLQKSASARESKL